MEIFHIKMNEKGEGRVNGDKGSLIRTSIPPEFMGSGINPSSTDLLAISLATCIGSSLAKSGQSFWLAQNFRIDVYRSLICNPKQLGGISMKIITRTAPDVSARQTLENVIKSSTVKRALSQEINLDIKILLEDEL